MRYLLDTNAVIAIIKDRQGPVAKHVRQHRRADVTVSAIVLHELFFGAFRSGRVEHNLAIVDTLQFDVLDLDRNDARLAAQLRAVLATRGTPIGPYDLLIAAHGLARGLTVVTANTREFSRIDGLTIEDWS